MRQSECEAHTQKASTVLCPGSESGPGQPVCVPRETGPNNLELLLIPQIYMYSYSLHLFIHSFTRPQ